MLEGGARYILDSDEAPFMLEGKKGWREKRERGASNCDRRKAKKHEERARRGVERMGRVVNEMGVGACKSKILSPLFRRLIRSFLEARGSITTQVKMVTRMKVMSRELFFRCRAAYEVKAGKLDESELF